jgi:transposase
MSDQTRELNKLAEDWAAAELDGDTASLREIMADDFVAVGPRGFVLSGEQWLNRHESGSLKYGSFGLNEAEIRTFGDAAIMVCRQTRVLDSYIPYILRRWGEGCRNGMKLYREIREQGYAYGASNVARLVAELRRTDVGGSGSITDRTQGGVVLPEKATVPTARQAAALFLKRREKLTADQQAYLDRLGDLDETLAEAYRLTQQFARMVRGLKGEKLDEWLKEADASEAAVMGHFAKGLKKDLSAVRGGLTESWSNGPVEGFIHKLKLIKRSMYGRAGFGLLRSRVLGLS